VARAARLGFGIGLIYIPAMSSKRSARSELPRWRITRIRSTPAAESGTVETADPESAIEEAVRIYGIKGAVAARAVGGAAHSLTVALSDERGETNGWARSDSGSRPCRGKPYSRGLET
jgi:hypothetical protein